VNSKWFRRRCGKQFTGYALVVGGCPDHGCAAEVNEARHDAEDMTTAAGYPACGV
jgi:hypothetical protein